MKKCILTAALTLSCLGFAAVGQADTVTIFDTGESAFWGEKGGDLAPGDVTAITGEEEVYDLSKIEASLENGLLTVTIYANKYFDNWAKKGTTWDKEYDPGDLFLSTDGWNPSGTPNHFSEDGKGNGTNWEAVIHLAGLVKVIDNTDTPQPSGDAYLYTTGQGTTQFGKYVAEQEAWFDPNEGSNATATGSWAFGTTNNDVIDRLIITMDLRSLSIGEELGLHYTMTCGNDVIEGAVPNAPVPEPATMLLFGTGLASLAGAIRRRK